MKSFFNPFEHLGNVVQLLRWSLLIIPVAILAGSASALFLWSLDLVTQCRFQHGWLLFLLPVAGILVAMVYRWIGGSAERGNNLIVEEIHEAGGGVPARMAPLILASTLVTHLFGGSAGREGTAVQMGGSLASAFGRIFGIQNQTMQMLLMCGVAAGFGSVFGTPMAGAVFAMEVLAVGRIEYQALIPTLIAAVVGDFTCTAWGIKHTAYHISLPDATALASGFHIDLLLLAKAVIAGIAFGTVSRLFSEMTHYLQKSFKLIPWFWARPVVGGLVVIGLVYLVGTRDYLGIGVTSPDPAGVSLVSAFQPGGASPWSWWWKILFTAVTLSCGFKGGEVTPLFFIGATLGNTLAWLLHAPVDLFAGLGFIAVFAGSANTPLACTIMGAELFGSTYFIYYATACYIAYYFSGHSGIYLSQRVAVPKRSPNEIPPEISLKEARELSRDMADMEFSLFRPFDFAATAPTTNNDSSDMPNKHTIVTTELGKVRIYLTPRERVKSEGFWARLNSKPVYRKLIEAAKTDGLMNAIAFPTHFGFSNGNGVQEQSVELPNPHMSLCVELIGRRDKLEDYCRKHGDLLKGKIVVYKPVEQWAMRATV